jgi:hypothetical protein
MTMMKVLAVKQVGESKPDAEKPWTRQKVRLEDAGNDKGFIDGQLFCNRFTPVPKEGDELDVKQIKQPDNPAWLPEIELNRKGGGGGGYSGPRVDDPKTRNSIAMQSSAKLAWEMLRFSLENGLLTPPEDVNPRHEWLKQMLEADAMRIYQLVKGMQDA